MGKTEAGSTAESQEGFSHLQGRQCVGSTPQKAEIERPSRPKSHKATLDR